MWIFKASASRPLHLQVTSYKLIDANCLFLRMHLFVQHRHIGNFLSQKFFIVCKAHEFHRRFISSLSFGKCDALEHSTAQNYELSKNHKLHTTKRTAHP